MRETTHPAGEHGFEAGGYSDCGHSFTAGPKGLTHVRYTPPASAQPSPLRAPTRAKDAVNGADPGPSQGLDVQTWIRRIVTTGASSQDAHGCC